jgi:hypothetical protein
MKKKTRTLALSRETVRLLRDRDTRDVRGGIGPKTVAVSVCTPCDR